MDDIPLRINEETVLFQTNLENKTVIPKTISWDKDKLPKKWLLQDATAPVPPEERDSREHRR